MLSAAGVAALHLADVAFPPGHPQAGDRGPVYAFVVSHPRGPILVDTGVGADDSDVDEWYRPVRRPLPDALAEHGYRLEDVALVVNTQLHFDHCGDNRLFVGTPIFVQRAECEAAHEPDYTINRWVDFPGAAYEVLEGEAEIAPGVRAVPTPGHTAGHQSVVLQTAEGVVVIAGQAIYTAAEHDGATDPRSWGMASAWDAERYADSARRLRDLRPARMLFSHAPRAVELAPGGSA